MSQTEQQAKCNREPKPPRLRRRPKFDCVYSAATPDRGTGLFAAVSFKRGQPVGRIHGTLKPHGWRSEYCMAFMDGAIEPDAPYRFVNHSCDPNCELIEWEITNEDNCEKVYELWLHTRRPVTQNEELTIDYAWDWLAAIPCHCGSPLCRGWICKQEELPLCLAHHSNDSNSSSSTTGIDDSGSEASGK
ncbi:MAG: SET domain-containing protein-lysine N-methyltransferase [Planctomycetia bacterium]|nr:SET domain-containing protein-lysine N-methyltransferase [Planctomycetia bacterium]